MKVLINLPTYNEKDNLKNLCEEILALSFEKNPYAQGKGTFDILIIDDNSPDGTGQIADELSHHYPGRVFVIHREEKLGLGSAIMSGFDYAIKNKYAFVINMDCDFSHNPKELPLMMVSAQQADLVIASRHIPGGKIINQTKKRKWLHWLAQQYTFLFLGTFVHDFTNSFKAYRVEMLKKIAFNDLLKKSAGYVWHTLLIYIIYKKGYKIKEVPSTFRERKAGKSKMDTKEMVSGLWAILKMRFFPLK